MKQILINLYKLYHKIASLPVYLLFHFWNVQYGEELECAGIPIIQKNRKARLSIGNRVKLISKTRANLVGLTNKCILVCNGTDAEIIIGDDSGLSGVVINARKSIKIGKRVLIGGNVRIFDHDFHPIHFEDRLGGSDSIVVKSVIIEDDVFIGTNSIILKGTVIGKGSVIGAGSVVNGVIPPGEIWAGNPARKIKNL